MTELRSQLQRVAYALFSIDVRALALLRIGMGLIMLWQLGGYLGVAGTYFADTGVLPRYLNRELLDGLGLSSAWTLYSFNGSAEFARWLIFIHGLAAVALVFGFFTRAATVVCLVLVWSLQMRNPLITTGGDVLLRMLLAWSLFLPLGAIASWDARVRRKTRWDSSQVLTVATAGLMCQLVCVYFFAGIAKLNSDWLGGHALAMTLSLEMYVNPWGASLREWTWLLRWGTWITLAIELGIVFLVFSPWHRDYFRGAALALFWILHLAIGLTMSIGIFSITCMLAWVIFIPRESWPRVTRRFVKQGNFISENTRRFEYSRLSTVLSVSLFVYMLTINLMNTAPRFFEKWGYGSWSSLGSGAMVIQEFKMFGRPPQWNASFVYEAQTKSGLNVKLFSVPVKRDAAPPSLYKLMQTQEWRRYYWNLMDLAEPRDERQQQLFDKLRQRLLEYHVQRWNRRNSNDPIAVASLTCHRRPIRPRSDKRYGAVETTRWAEYRATDPLETTDVTSTD